MDFVIRLEREDDYRIVEELTREAFWDLHVPGCVEHFVLHKLRKCSAYTPELGLVAEKEGKIIGNIAYTRSIIIDEPNIQHEVICFGPVSVLPSFQKQGVGSALIRYSLEKARDMGYTAVCIYGDPRYYSRFGFRCAEKYDIKTADGKFAVALLALELQPGALNNVKGRFYEDPVFEVNEDDFAAFENTFTPKEKRITETQSEFKLMVSLRY